LIGPKPEDPHSLIGPKPEDPHSLIGPKPEDPHSLIGPKPEDPRALIGPKPEDPHSLGGRLAVLARGLSPIERVALDWLLARGERGQTTRPGTPGGLPPGLQVTLAQALGVVAIGSERDGAAARPQARRFVLVVTDLAPTP